MRTYLTLFILLLTTLCAGFGYMQYSAESFVDGTKMGIPDEAIRLRILANSDQIQDQWVKRQVRDQVVEEFKSWKERPKTIEEARGMLRERLSRFQEIAESTIRRYGYSYPVKVDLGQVPFPTKLYGNQLYPAGDYEALRITLGKGEGSNWWCVLFPPLCFVDMSNGDAVPQKDNEENPTPTNSPFPVASSENEVHAATFGEEMKEEAAKQQQKPVEVRFFLVDKVTEWMGK